MGKLDSAKKLAFYIYLVSFFTMPFTDLPLIWHIAFRTGLIWRFKSSAGVAFLFNLILISFSKYLSYSNCVLEVIPCKIKVACLNMLLNWQLFIFHHCHGLLAWYLHMYSFPSISTWEYATPLSPAAGMFSSSSNISDSSQTKHLDSIHPEDVTYSPYTSSSPSSS